MSTVSIRAYEQKTLPLDQRLSSLAKRFSALEQADGISPFEPSQLYQWVAQSNDVAAIQTGLLLLQLSQFPTNAQFDVLGAMKAWNEADRQMFINFLRIWDF